MTHHRIVLYTKPGCHLCGDALALLNRLQNEIALTIQTIDITTDNALFKKYFDKIPVLCIDDRVTLAAPVDEKSLRAALK